MIRVGENVRVVEPHAAHNEEHDVQDAEQEAVEAHLNATSTSGRRQIRSRHVEFEYLWLVKFAINSGIYLLQCCSLLIDTRLVHIITHNAGTHTHAHTSLALRRGVLSAPECCRCVAGIVELKTT